MKGGDRAAIAARMARLRDALATVEPFSETRAEETLRAVAEKSGEAAALYIHPLRIALLGMAVSPSIFTVLTLIGRERAVLRIDRLIEFLQTGGASGT